MIQSFSMDLYLDFIQSSFLSKASLEITDIFTRVKPSDTPLCHIQLTPDMWNDMALNPQPFLLLILYTKRKDVCVCSVTSVMLSSL